MAGDPPKKRSGWFQSRLNSDLVFATTRPAADATGQLAVPDAQPSLTDVLHALRLGAGGVAEGFARLPADILKTPGMFASQGPALVTTGRGQVRTDPNSRSAGAAITPLLDAVARPLEGAATAIGDVVGGIPQTPKDSIARALGFLPGNLLGWKAAERVPALLGQLQRVADPKYRYAERLRRGLELADAANPIPRAVAAPRAPVPLNLEKLPSEMSPVELRHNAAVAKLADLEGLKAQGITVHPLEQATRQAQHAEAQLLLELSKEGGATLTPGGQHFTGSGYAVARPALTAFAKSPEEMRAFLQKPEVRKALDGGAHLGKWTDPETKVTEINITDIVPDEKRARALGLARNQKAVGHLENGVYQGDVNLPEPVRSAAAAPRGSVAASPDVVPGPVRAPGGLLGSRADMLQQELGYDHRTQTPQPIPGTTAPIPPLRAAWEAADGRVFAGTDHGDAANVAEAAGYSPTSLTRDGFVTPEGKFLTRDEALKQRGVSLSSDMSGAQVFGREDAPWFGLLSQELPGPRQPRKIATPPETYTQMVERHLADPNWQSPPPVLGPLYHGSPHKFNKFDINQVGTGEGAAAYGHGLYFAENPGVAQDYRDRLAGEPQILNLRVAGRSVGPHNGFDYSPRGTGNTPAAMEDNIRSTLLEQLLVNQADLVGVGPKGVQKHALKVLDDITKNYPNEWPEAVGAAKSLRAKMARPGGVALKVDQPGGAMYKVEVPGTDPERFLNWDAPFSEQPPNVKQAVTKLLGTQPSSNMTGEEMYNLLGGSQFASRNKRLSINGMSAHAYLDRVMQPTPEGAAGFTQQARNIAVELLHKSEGNVHDALVLLANEPEYRSASGTRQAVRQVLEHAGQQNVQYLRSPFTGPQAVSQGLNKAGVPGIRYFDQGSRDAGQGTRNYVLFGDQGINILDRQGQAGLNTLLGTTGLVGGGLLAPAVRPAIDSLWNRVSPGR